MRIARYLKPEHVKLSLAGGHPDDIDPERDEARERERLKLEVMEEITDLFMETGQIRNRSKFFKDYVYREKQGSTAVGEGIAVPHVRSLQPRGLALVFARSKAGVLYDAPDGEPVRLFFGIAAPSYDDDNYLQFYRWVAQSFLQEEWLFDALLEAEDARDVIGILSGLH